MPSTCVLVQRLSADMLVFPTASRRAEREKPWGGRPRLGLIQPAGTDLPISLALSPPDHGALPGPSGDRRGWEGHGTSSGTRRPQFKLWLQNLLCPWAGLNITFPLRSPSLQNRASSALQVSVSCHNLCSRCQHSSCICDNCTKLGRMSLSYGVYILGRRQAKSRRQINLKQTKSPKTLLTDCEAFHEK